MPGPVSVGCVYPPFFNRDYPIIQAYMLLMAMLFLVGNFLTDVIQVRLDPRMKEARE
ncbi:hypothetical protein OS21_12260 [Dickeya oryzae]